MISALIQSLRPRQWTKNLLVFAALFFVPGALLYPALIGRAVAAFFLFSLAAGAGYLVNDVRDRKYDLEHPRKKLRPVASGRLSPTAAITAAVVLVIVVFAGSIWLDVTGVVLPESATPLHGFAFPFTVTIAAYLFLTFIYSAWLRNVALLDVMLLAGGFTLRAVAGAVALKVIISPWLLLCAGLLALYLALGKRRQELIRLGIRDGKDYCEGEPKVRSSLSGYTIALLDQLLIIAASVNLMSYSLYTFSASGHPDNRLMLTIPFVVYGIFRYHSLIHRQDAGEAPDEVLLNDVPLLVTIILWAVSVTILFFWPGFRE
jgi:4-hydroxybenzoate polyprenyltransferase